MPSGWASQHLAARGSSLAQELAGCDPLASMHALQGMSDLYPLQNCCGGASQGVHKTDLILLLAFLCDWSLEPKGLGAFLPRVKKPDPKGKRKNACQHDIRWDDCHPHIHSGIVFAAPLDVLAHPAGADGRRTCLEMLRTTSLAQLQTPSNAPLRSNAAAMLLVALQQQCATLHGTLQGNVGTQGLLLCRTEIDSLLSVMLTSWEVRLIMP